MPRWFFWLAFNGLVCAPCVPGQQTGIIGGVVRNGWSKTPIKRAIVTLRTTGTDIMEALTYSEANGAFAFTGVPAGDYTLCARLSGYERACFGGGDDLGRPVALLTLTAGQRKQDVVLAMLPEGSVSGTVTDEDGDGIRGARVELLRPVYRRRTLHWQQAGTATANEKGEYHLTFLQPGEYRVMATGQFQAVSRIRPEAMAGVVVPEETYASQFYPGSASIDAAVSLTLNAGNDLKGIDFTLSATPQVLVSGAVECPTGIDPNTFVNLQLIPEFPVPGERNLSFGTNGPEYRFQMNVPAGRYRIVASMEANDRRYRAEQRVEAGPEVDNLTLTLAPGAPLTGKLVVEGEPMRKSGPYTIRLTPGDDTQNIGQPPTADVSESGAFEFPSVLPGIWDIGVSPMPTGSYIKSMRLGEQDVLTADMTLEEGARKPLSIVLSTKGAVVSGNVMKPDASGPLTSLRSRLLLAPSGRYEAVQSFYETTLTDARGHFEFKGVTPGTYRLYAFDRLQSDEFWKPDFLKPFTAAAGDAFEVTESARVTHDATLIVRDAGVIE
jgi:hypothetical protein